MNNPYATPVLRGLGGEVAPGDRYVYVPRIHQIGFSLAGNEFLRDRASEFTDEGDFLWRAVSFPSYTGSFRIQFTDANGYTLSNTLIDYTAFVNPSGSRVPFPIFPEVVFPKSSKISISIQDTSGAANDIIVVLWGVLRGKLR